jgi:hypothetical protein
MLVVGVLAGCGGNMQPPLVPVAATETATLPPLPTQTRIAVVSSPTPAPLITVQPVTPSPGPSPTSPLAATPTPAPATLTATRVPTLAGVSIEYFTTDVESVKPGENVTLFWSVRGADAVKVYRVDADGERLWRWDVNKNGQITVSTRTGDRDVARFLLSAEVAGAEAVQQPLLIPLLCPETWFFDPAPDACPAAPPQISIQAEQTFERGRMIWVETQDRIYVLFEDGNAPQWAQYPDNFNEGDPERDEALIPPSGLLQPVRGFGLIWRSNPRVQERLGWASSTEVGFEGMLQSDSAEPSVATLYMRSRAGDIVALNAFTSEWEALPLAAATSP